MCARTRQFGNSQPDDANRADGCGYVQVTGDGLVDNGMPRLSFCIATRNRGVLIGETLDSLLAWPQHFPEFS